MPSEVVIEFDLFAVEEADNCVTIVMQSEDRFNEIVTIQKEKWLR